MSDIYLQITETPTVVTLSTPVISGALSSTVTVANTVTVALDANSLSALENVTVTVGAAITGTVTVSNFPASQAVTFSAVSISNFPASQAVTFSDASLTNTQLRASAVTVGGTITVGNFPASQAVTFGQAIVSASNITGLNNSVGTDGNTPTSTNFIKIGGHQDGSNQVEHIVHVSAGGSMKVDASDSTVTFGAIRGTVTIGNTVTIAGTVTANPTGTQTIAGTVTANVVSSPSLVGGGYNNFQDLIGNNSFSVYGNVDIESINSALPAGTNQIGSVTASISGTVPISISSVTVGNSVTIGSFATSVTARLINPAGTTVTYAEVGTAGSPSIDVLSIQGVTSGTPINVYPQQGTTVSNTNFTSTTASTTLVSAVTLRESLTVFNEGAGNLHISPGATCTTISYQVRLSAGDYWECPQGQLSLLHSAVYATAGTARVCQVS
jgi:hypothetical protein